MLILPERGSKRPSTENTELNYFDQPLASFHGIVLLQDDSQKYFKVEIRTIKGKTTD